MLLDSAGNISRRNGRRGLAPITAHNTRAGEMQPLHLNLLDLQEGQCRWPFGDGPAFTFCGCDVQEGSPYCPAHHFIAYVPARPYVDRSLPTRRRAA